jgi:hypothetical protein
MITTHETLVNHLIERIRGNEKLTKEEYLIVLRECTDIIQHINKNLKNNGFIE